MAERDNKGRFAKGNKGKKKGAKNRIQKNLVNELLAIKDTLAKENKGLEDEARNNPKWFYENFIKPIIPKDINVGLEGDLTITLVNYAGNDTT